MGVSINNEAENYSNQCLTMNKVERQFTNKLIGAQKNTLSCLMDIIKAMRNFDLLLWDDKEVTYGKFNWIVWATEIFMIIFKTSKSLFQIIENNTNDVFCGKKISEYFHYNSIDSFY